MLHISGGDKPYNGVSGGGVFNEDGFLLGIHRGKSTAGHVLAVNLRSISKQLGDGTYFEEITSSLLNIRFTIILAISAIIPLIVILFKPPNIPIFLIAFSLLVWLVMLVLFGSFVEHHYIARSSNGLTKTIKIKNLLTLSLIHI